VTTTEFKPTPHPILALPRPEQLRTLALTKGGREWLQQWLTAREEKIALMKYDPLRHGWELTGQPPPNSPYDWRPVWKDADELLATHKDILCLGGNRSAKSEWAAKRCVEMMVNKPGSIVWCLALTNETSIRDQQRLIWKYLPPEWKSAKRSQQTRITFSPKDGFAGSAFTAPNGSECWFKNYKQDRDTIEGGQVDLWWGDELIPVDWVITLRGRTVDRKGKGIVTFTPVNGYNATVGEYVTGATVREWVDCEQLPQGQHWPGGAPGKIPYIMDCLDPQYAVIFFQSKWNPFIDYGELLNLWKGRGPKQILIRLHGVTDKSSGNVFPRFRTHNIVPASKIPKEGTNYRILDFAWHRRWAIIWMRVLEIKGKKRIYVYREFPDFPTYGEWVINSEQKDGDKGPAQGTDSWSINDYKRMVLAKEGWSASALATALHSAGSAGRGSRAEASRRFWDVDDEEEDSAVFKTPPGVEEIFKSYGDSRSGHFEAIAQEEGTSSILQMLNEESEGLPPLYVEAAVGGHEKMLIREGVTEINKWLEYDEDKPISIQNEPILYVSEECQNTIACMKLWTGAAGLKGASKDFIDLLRMAAFMKIEHVPAGSQLVTGGMG